MLLLALENNNALRLAVSEVERRHYELPIPVSKQEFILNDKTNPHNQEFDSLLADEFPCDGGGCDNVCCYCWGVGGG